MEKQLSLSSEVSRARAVLAGGGSARDVLAAIRRWRLRAPVKGRKRALPSLLQWCDRLGAAIQDALPLGAPTGKLLREVHPMIVQEERACSRLQGIERQFAFQGAIGMVLPWAAAAMSGGFGWNMFTMAGIVLQILGLASFYLAVRRASRVADSERAWLFGWLVSSWMRVMAGMSLHAALSTSLSQSQPSVFGRAWTRWMEAYDGGATLSVGFAWPSELRESAEASRLLSPLLRSGSPSQDALSEYLAQLQDERRIDLEDRLSLLPTRLSLIFCGLFAPALFLILMGALWPSLSVLSI